MTHELTYALMVCFTAFSVFTFLNYKRVRKHDQMLFPFCQLRRDIIAYLKKNVLDAPNRISQKEGEAILKLLDIVNQTISNYNRHKTVMFNLREMQKYLKKYQRASSTTLEIPDNPEIHMLYQNFGRLLVKAFIAYTPLIRWELTLRLIAYASHAGYRAGKKERARRVAKYVVNHSEKVRNDARRYGLIESGAPAV